MNASIETLKREIKHLPPVARKRAERALGIAQPDNEHRVFVYGTLLTGEGNAHWARGARRTPAFVRSGETRIQGELLTVDDEGFKSMDRLEGYPRLYRREEIDVFTSQGRARAWVYIMNRLPEGAKVIAGGDWREYRRKSRNR